LRQCGAAGTAAADVPDAACCGVAAKATDEQVSRAASNVERIIGFRIGTSSSG